MYSENKIEEVIQLYKNSTQLGIKNIKQRLKLLYGEAGEFSLREENEQVAQLRVQRHTADTRRCQHEPVDDDARAPDDG